MHLRAKNADTGALRAAAGLSSKLASLLKSASGFTLTEALATVVIVGLVTCMLAGGITLATRQYMQSMMTSESQMLYSTLQRILDTELRYAGNVQVDASGNVTSFSSYHYKALAAPDGGYIATDVLCTVTENPLGGVKVQPASQPGQLAMCSEISDDAAINRFIGNGAYNYGLEASVESLIYDSDKKHFKVVLVISNGNDNNAELVREEFTVRALNVSIY